MQPLPTPVGFAGELPQSTFRDVNDQATGTTTPKFVSRHELTEKIKIITTLQEYKERGTSVQSLTINDSLEDLNIELERVRRFVQIHGTVDSYKTGLILFVNIVELVNKFSRRHFHLDNWGQHFINYDLQKSENYIFMMVEENKKVFSPATMLLGTLLGSAAFYHFTHTITQKVGEKVGDVFGTELASTLISHFTKNPDALSNILGGFGVGGGGSNNNNNNNNGNNNNNNNNGNGKYPAGESPKERKQKMEEERNKKYQNLFTTTGQPPPPQQQQPYNPPTPPPSPPQPIRAVPIIATPTPPAAVQRPVSIPVVTQPTVDFFVPPSIQIPKRQREMVTATFNKENEFTLPVPTFTQVIADNLDEMQAGPSTLPNGISMFVSTTTTTPNETFQNVFKDVFNSRPATIQEIPDDGSMTNYTEVSSGGTSHKRRRKRMKNVLVI